MEILLAGLVLLSLLLAAACVSLFLRLSRQRDEAYKMVAAEATAKTRTSVLEEEMVSVREENASLRLQKESALEEKRSAEKREALAQQKLQDFEQLRDQMSKAAHEAVLKGGTELSNKLLTDHKREAAAQAKEGEERTQKVTQGLMEQFLKVTQTVGHLHEQTKTTIAKNDLLYRALSSPGGAGQHAEIGLENSLKNLGLEAGRDFVMQYHIAATEDSGRLRPDAVIFLPQGKVLVVDSKASKHLIDLAEAENESGEQLALENLRRSMNQHLKALVSKDYKTAIEQAHRNAGRKDQVVTIVSAMCLPNEAAVEKLLKADPEFRHKIQRENMLLISPVTLSALFSWASMEIGLERQAENQEKIIDQVRKLVDSVHVALGYAEKVGKGIKSAADEFEKFSRSINRTLIPRISSLAKMGISGSKGKTLPKPLPMYEVRNLEDLLTIEGETEDAMILELTSKAAEG